MQWQAQWITRKSSMLVNLSNYPKFNKNRKTMKNLISPLLPYLWEMTKWSMLILAYFSMLLLGKILNFLPCTFYKLSWENTEPIDTLALIWITLPDNITSCTNIWALIPILPSIKPSISLIKTPPFLVLIFLVMKFFANKWCSFLNSFLPNILNILPNMKCSELEMLCSIIFCLKKMDKNFLWN